MVDDVRLLAAAAPSRVSLFITCFNDTMFPQTGRAVVTVLERLGVAVDFPLEQTCCGQMHFNTGYAEETIPLVRRFVDAFGDAEVVVSPSASCVGHGPRLLPARGRARPATPGWRARSAALVAARARAVRAARRPARRRGRRGLLPAPGHLSPDVPQPADAARRRPAAAAAARGRGHRPRRAARGRAVLRLRRHVRGQERRHVDRDAVGQGAQRSSTPAPRCA